MFVKDEIVGLGKMSNSTPSKLELLNFLKPFFFFLISFFLTYPVPNYIINFLKLDFFRENLRASKAIRRFLIKRIDEKLH